MIALRETAVDPSENSAGSGVGVLDFQLAREGFEAHHMRSC